MATNLATAARAVVVVDAGRVHLKGLTNLQGLVLPKQITAAGIAELQQALPNCKIIKLPPPPLLPPVRVRKTAGPFPRLCL